jgi:hypothetical protein
MGSLTPILFYNDSIQMIMEDPTINRRLYNATAFNGNPLSATDAGIVLSDGNLHISYRGHRKTWLDKIMEKIGWKRIDVSRKHWSGGGSFAIGLKTMHADCPRTIVIYGNTWIDLSDALGDMKKYKDREYFKDCLQIADEQVKTLKKQLKEATTK